MNNQQMRPFFCLIVFSLFSSTAMIAGAKKIAPGNSQEGPIYTVVEKRPEFPGGEAEMRRYIDRNLNQRKTSFKQKFSEKITVSFVINADGSIQDAKIVEGVSPEYDQETIKVINGMPKWRPGSQSGRKVRVRYFLTLN